MIRCKIAVCSAAMLLASALLYVASAGPYDEAAAARSLFSAPFQTVKSPTVFAAGMPTAQGLVGVAQKDQALAGVYPLEGAHVAPYALQKEPAQSIAQSPLRSPAALFLGAAAAAFTGAFLLAGGAARRAAPAAVPELPVARTGPGLRAKLAQACRQKVAESFEEELLAKVVWEVTQKRGAPSGARHPPLRASAAGASTPDGTAGAPAAAPSAAPAAAPAAPAASVSPAVFAVEPMLLTAEASGNVVPTTPAKHVIVDSSPEKELYRATREQVELIESLDGWAEEKMMPMLLDVNKCWQPQDHLPDASQEDWLDRVAEIKEMNADMPDAVLVALVGDMVTEEALPTYQSMLNTMDGIADQTGSDQTAWARWTRAWTAEENRHGDLLNKYLWCTGRVNMRAVEKTIQYLIGEGMDAGLDKNPYLGYVYTSFQERATKVSHGNTGKLAKQYGDATMGKICNLIAADESRHEKAYQMVVEKLFEIDPDGALMAYENMMKKNIVMPAALMYDGENNNLWDQFSGAAEKIGVYTAEDYAQIIEFLNRRWELADRSFTKGTSLEAQEYLMTLPDRIRRLAKAAARRKAKKGVKEANISWIYNRSIQY